MNQSYLTPEATWIEYRKNNEEGRKEDLAYCLRTLFWVLGSGTICVLIFLLPLVTSNFSGITGSIGALLQMMLVVPVIIVLENKRTLDRFCEKAVAFLDEQIGYDWF